MVAWAIRGLRDTWKYIEVSVKLTTIYSIKSKFFVPTAGKVLVWIPLNVQYVNTLKNVMLWGVH